MVSRPNRAASRSYCIGVLIETKRGRLSRNIENQYPPQRLLILSGLVLALSYLAARLGGALIIRPQIVSPLWLGNVVLASLLLLAPRRFWPALLSAGLAGFLFYDLQAGGSIRSIVWLLLSNAVEVLVAALALSFSFNGVPRLNNVKALAKYSFYGVFLAPFVGAFLGALSSSSQYWTNWSIAFLSEAIGFLVLMPAILGWAREIPTWSRKPRAYSVEAIVLLLALIVLGRFAFATPGSSSPPALLYSLVPLLLWATLRFGSTGVGTSMTAIAFVAIWGAVHGRGPFTGPGPLVNVLSLQLFLFFTAAPFMALAAVVEESNDAEQALRQRDNELNEAQRMAQTGSWQWDPATDAVTWSAELYRLARYNRKLPPPSLEGLKQFFAPEDWDRLKQCMEMAFRTGTPYELDLEGIRSDGTKVWITNRGEAVADASGRPIYLRGTTQDVTDRKLSEEALFAMSGRLITAQEEERSRIARELHDDLSQRMVLLQIGLDHFKQEMPDLSPEAQQHLDKVAAMAMEVSSDIHNLSHQLHPSKLETLGLVSSLRGFCREFSVQHKLEVQFLERDIPRQIPNDVTLCLFRITQEALRNVARHSGAVEATVELSANTAGIELRISDPGRGFDIESAKGADGLGLISMRERLRLVGGHLSIESGQSRGTRIRARVPQTAINALDGGDYPNPNGLTA